MDLQKAKILLEKVNALYKSMSADARNVSTIEKDLMKSYLLQLYEVFLDLPVSTPPAELPPVEIIKSSPKITLHKPEAPVAPVVTASPKTVRQEEPPKPEPAPAPVPAPEPAPVPVIDKKSEPTVLPTAPKVEPVESQVVTPSPAPKPTPAPYPVDDELEELFAFTSAKELSEKLSELPITDIKKAMGLNERIFTINELFGGDQSAFDATVATLNQFRSFEEAKNYLIRNVGGKYNWASKDKKSKAKTFIKLIKRRYN